MMKRMMVFYSWLACLVWGGEVADFVEAAEKKHGEFGGKAARFLVAGMPKGDRESLGQEFLMTNLDLALKAKKEFPWAKEIPEEVFLNDVLPYASLDETREDWRSFFYPKCKELVKDAKTTTEAAQAINKGIFNLIKVHYNTGRKAPNQSPAESIKLGKATCTGLSIILVDACRSVGVPARIAGTALWYNKRGNHTWVEIYDGGEWYFTGADEYDAKGLNRGWFTGDASKAIEDQWQHAIWASSWKETGSHFPMVWDIRNKEVPGVNVTSRYVKKKEVSEGVVYFRVWDRKGGKRVVATLNEAVKSKAGTADLNDMAELKVKEGDELKVTLGGETRSVKVPAGKTVDLYWDQLK
ncbi:MAG: transglutaminase-like domain-containing protein [Akkermansiaceae bacterium]|jgi:hypothetical protein|nr:transglutaminase-like domain-containing protein [Akkermansiaceae bacterium]